MNKDFKILIVDDTPELLDIAIRTVAKAGYIVFSAESGAECLEVLQNEKPDIILLDVMLPDVNGKDLAMRIKNNPELSSVFIILLSSLRTSPDFIAEGLEDGADGYIVRPVESRELLARIASACRIIATEKELKTALIKYRSLFSSMQEGVYLHEMVYNEQGKAVDYRIIEANPASEHHLDIKPEDAIGKLASELYGTNEAPNLELYAKVTKTGNAVSFEQLFEPMGKYFQISAYASGEGRFATAFSDITDRKQAEEKIKLKNKELELLNVEKDKFFSIIAHDLKSPFNGFLGLTQLIEEKLSVLTKEQVQTMVGTMRESAVNLFRLLENLLQWAQMQKGSISFSPTDILLYQVIHEIVALESEHAKNKNIRILFDIPESLFVYADQNMLQTVIRNLVSNALKFTPSGGVINLSAKATIDNSVKICVKDTGIGMDAEMVANLFRLDINTSRKGTDDEPSTGLGLILCKEFIEKHGGSIRVVSSIDKGSKFHLSFPANPQAENKLPVVTEFEETKSHSKKLKILIAEDDSTSEMLLSIGLDSISKEIISKKSGTEAVKFCNENSDLDLVLMDIQLPGINGYEATRQIRQFNKDVVIIAQTAFSNYGDRERAMEAGCNDYISKPLNFAILNKMIQKHCKQR